jgi:hypothetical protein
MNALMGVSQGGSLLLEICFPFPVPCLRSSPIPLSDRDIALTKLQVLQSAVRLRPPVRQLSPVLQESGLILDWLSSSAIADLGFPGIIGVIQSTASQTGWGESVGLDLGQNLANSRV